MKNQALKKLLKKPYAQWSEAERARITTRLTITHTKGSGNPASLTTDIIPELPPELIYSWCKIRIDRLRTYINCCYLAREADPSRQLESFTALAHLDQMILTPKDYPELRRVIEERCQYLQTLDYLNEAQEGPVTAIIPMLENVLRSCAKKHIEICRLQTRGSVATQRGH